MTDSIKVSDQAAFGKTTTENSQSSKWAPVRAAFIATKPEKPLISLEDEGDEDLTADERVQKVVERAQTNSKLQEEKRDVIAEAARAEFEKKLSFVKENKFTEQFPFVARTLCTTEWEASIGMLIVLNCILIGVEVHQCPVSTSPRFKTPKPVDDPHISADCPYVLLTVSEHIFTCIFLVEFMLRFAVFGWEHYKDPANMGDGFLVWFTGVLPTWILSGSSGGGELSALTALRATRLFRVVRVIKRNEMFKEMWLLLKGIMDSIRTMFWTTIVILFVNFFFSVFSVLVIGDSSLYENTPQKAEWYYFDGLDNSLFTLLQLATADDWASRVVRPIMIHQPFTWVFFVAYLLIAFFALMNLITAVLVETAMEQTHQDEETKRAEMHAQREEEFNNLSALFKAMDADGSGDITKDEYESALSQKADITAKFFMCGFEDPKEIKNLYNDMDDGDGELTIDEFVDGIRQMKGIARNKDVVAIQKQLNRFKKLVDQKTQHLKELSMNGDASQKGDVDLDATLTDQDEQEIQRALENHLNLVDKSIAQMVNTCRAEIASVRADIEALWVENFGELPPALSLRPDPTPYSPTVPLGTILEDIPRHDNRILSQSRSPLASAPASASASGPAMLQAPKQDEFGNQPSTGILKKSAPNPGQNFKKEISIAEKSEVREFSAN